MYSTYVAIPWFNHHCKTVKYIHFGLSFLSYYYIIITVREKLNLIGLFWLAVCLKTCMHACNFATATS